MTKRFDIVDLILWCIMAACIASIIAINAGYEIHKGESVKAGHAEYYINPTNYNKEWRWK